MHTYIHTYINFISVRIYADVIFRISFAIKPWWSMNYFWKDLMIQNYKLFNCVNDRVCCQCNLIKRDERKYNYYIFRSSIVTEYDLNLKMNHKVVIQIYQRCAEYKVTRFKIWKTLKNKNTKALHCYLKALPSIRRGKKERKAGNF